MRIKIKRLNPRARLPKRGSASAAGYDLSAGEDVTIRPGQTALIKTGLALEIPRGYFAMLCPRGSLALKQYLDMPHSIGIVDSDYRGEWIVPLRNLSARRTARIPAGERIAQAIFLKHGVVDFVTVAKLGATKRNQGRFGSTGKS